MHGILQIEVETVTEDLIQEIQNGIWKWYPFRKKAQVLHLSDSSCLDVEQEQKYDYIVAVRMLEVEKEPVTFLKKCI